MNLPVYRTKAYLVLGAESSGTRLLTAILVSGGCVGNSDHYQWWDDHPLSSQDRPIVWRRSYPHGVSYPNIGEMVEALRRNSRADITAVVPVRAQHPCTSSLVLRGHAPDPTVAAAKLQEATLRLFRDLQVHRLPFVLITYEDLVARPEQTQLWLYASLGLPHVPDIEVEDGNEKHWREGRWPRR